MQATSAEASRPASSASVSPLELCTMSEMPSSAISFSVGPLGSSFDDELESRSRSTRSRATACSRWLTPLSGTSALAIAMIRLRTRSPAGLNSSVSTPSGTTCSWSGETPKSSAMSAADVDDTVSSSGIRRATCFCISAKPYHRRTSGFRHHFAAATSSTRSRVIGWWTVATTGRPVAAIVSSPCRGSGCRARRRSRRGARRAGAPRAGRTSWARGSAAVHVVEQLEHVDAVVDLAGPRDPERIRLAVEVEAGHLR